MEEIQFKEFTEFSLMSEIQFMSGLLIGQRLSGWRTRIEL